MNASTPQMTAILRGAYTAFGTGALMFLTMWPTFGLQAGIVAGGVAALGALGFRAGVEGRWDSRSGAQKATDEHKHDSDQDTPHTTRDVIGN